MVMNGRKIGSAAIVACLLAAVVVLQVDIPKAVRAAQVNSYSTLGTISMDAGSCGPDETASVITGSGIRRIIDGGSGVMYVVGCFTNFAGVAEADYVAKWDGTSWSGLGSSGDISGIVYDGVLYKGNLVIVGDFNNAGGVTAADMIAGWDQSLNGGTGGWFAFPTPDPAFGYSPCNNGANSPKDGLSDYLAAIAIDDEGTTADTSDDTVIVGGNMYYGICDGRSGYQIPNTGKVARWNGASWEALDDSSAFNFSGQLYIPRAILVDGSNVYIGSYKQVSPSFTESLSKYKHMFIKFDGTAFSYPITSVSVYGDGAGIGVFTLEKFGSHILLGGTFTSLNYVASHLATYDGTSISNFQGFTVAGGSGAIVRGIKAMGSQVVIVNTLEWHGVEGLHIVQHHDRKWCFL